MMMSVSLRSKRLPICSYHRAFSASVVPDEKTGREQSKLSSCPVTGGHQLKHMTSLPLVGSMLNHLFSDRPKFDPKVMYDSIVEDRKRYGTFYTGGFPGFGNGIRGTFHKITDPNEMLKVIRAEGAHPSGVVQSLWTFISILRKDGSAMMDGADNGILGQGERWKRQRTFLQTGMLDPRAAKGYVPGIVKAAKLASQGAPSHTEDLNRYLNLCAFDMFSTFMFGELTRCADPNTANEENLKFCSAAIDAMDRSSTITREPYEFVMNQIGLETAAYKQFATSWGTVRKIGMKKLTGFIDRYESDDLNELERASYLANSLDRLESSDISREEMLELCLFALFVGVDTTSGVTSWNLVHLALNQDVQSKLHQDLSEAIQETGGQLTAKTLEKKMAPYLNNVIKETNRLTPPFGSVAFKRASKSAVEIHGVTLPKNSMFVLATIYNDPNYVPDAKEFKPERWLPEEVEGRKGTSLELMDHALFRDSFGQGARRCPGSRVAANEVLIMIAQLVLDYEIVSPVKTLDEISYDMTALLTPNIPQLEFRPRKRKKFI